jgi:DNA-binding NtrC family response regulator
MHRTPPGARDLVEVTETLELRGSAPPAQADLAGLVLLYADDFERLPPAYVLGAPELVIGRDPAADVAIARGAVSRRHARLTRRGDRWILADLGGRNGTLVNGELVREAALEHLDVIRFGDAIFQFVEREAEGYARHRIDGALVDPVTSAARPAGGAGRVVGGYQIQRIAAELRQVAKSELSIVLLGESGTGKEVFAEQVHDWSGRRGPLLTVNCSAIPATLIEAELFGHKRGAFSGADRDRPGLVRAAHGGTLFLDEIGDMPLEAQAKLLRVLQSKEVTPLGATSPERVDVRFVCATHRDLVEMQQGGRFRRDLFARLNEFSATLPPLRRRKEDLYALCLALAARHGQPDAEVTLPFMIGLCHHDFPYNVRELEALIKRWAALGAGPVLDESALGDAIRSRAEPRPSDKPPPTPGADTTLDAIPRGVAPSAQHLRDLLARHHGNIAAVARELGRDRSLIHRWLNRHGIAVDEYR